MRGRPGTGVSGCSPGGEALPAAARWSRLTPPGRRSKAKGACSAAGLLPVEPRRRIGQWRAIRGGRSRGWSGRAAVIGGRRIAASAPTT